MEPYWGLEHWKFVLEWWWVQSKLLGCLVQILVVSLSPPPVEHYNILSLDFSTIAPFDKPLAMVDYDWQPKSGCWSLSGIFCYHHLDSPWSLFSALNFPSSVFFFSQWSIDIQMFISPSLHGEWIWCGLHVRIMDNKLMVASTFSSWTMGTLGLFVRCIYILWLVVALYLL